MLRKFVYAFTAVTHLLLLDQIVKAVSVSGLKDRAAVEVIPNLFNLAYVENRGCAWGMFQGHVWPLAVFGLVALGLLVWKRRSVFPAGWAGVVAEMLLYAGILGNLIDRIVRGFVVDMFDFHWGIHHFPCFNIADSLICIAVGLMLLASFTDRAKKPGT